MFWLRNLSIGFEKSIGFYIVYFVYVEGFLFGVWRSSGTNRGMGLLVNSWASIPSLEDIPSQNAAKEIVMKSVVRKECFSFVAIVTG